MMATIGSSAHMSLAEHSLIAEAVDFFFLLAASGDMGERSGWF
jgi:hypothetical protein